MSRTVHQPGQHDLFKPPSSWVQPVSLPAVPSGTLIAVDTETRDVGLARHEGTGWATGQGHVCGVSWAYREGGGICSGYMPVAHPDTAVTVDLDVVQAWLGDILARCRVVFQNASYDMGWLGVRPSSTLQIGDTQTMAVLLDENRRSYTLDSICQWLGIEGKDETLLREAVVTHGGNPKKIKEHIWQLPARYVGPYGEQDAVSTLLAAETMEQRMRQDGLMEAYRLECDLAPYVCEMRRRGIRIDVDVAEQNQRRLLELRDERLDAITRLVRTRRPVTIKDIRSPAWLRATLGDMGISYMVRKETGNAVLDKEFLEHLSSPIGPLIAQARALNDGAEKFIGSFILGFLHRGRLHAEVHQLRDADETGSSGTRTYRFSYSSPPLQQMNRADPDRADPSHKDYVAGFVDIGTMVRDAFIPEDGCVWNAPDYSQQEYRLIVHYAARLRLDKVSEAVHYYNTDPNADYHNLVVQMTGLTRKRAKDCNFAKAYGAGIPKFALMANLTTEDARAIVETYDEKLPFVAQLARYCSARAESRGYIRLLDGRRCRFDEWEAAWIPPDELEEARSIGMSTMPCSMEEARLRQQNPDHPWAGKRLKRAKTHKAGNKLIQGGAAVQMKKAMRACCHEGYIPMIQMHDELGFSHDTEEACQRTATIMREVVPTLVPMKVDDESGPSWGRARYSFRDAVRLLSA